MLPHSLLVQSLRGYEDPSEEYFDVMVDDDARVTRGLVALNISTSVTRAMTNSARALLGKPERVPGNSEDVNQRQEPRQRQTSQ